MSISLSVHLSTYLSICPSVYISVYLSICLSVHLSTYLSICLSVHLSFWSFDFFWCCFFTHCREKHFIVCLIWSNKHCSKNIILKTVVPANFYVSWKCRFQSCRAKLYEEENSNKMVFTYKKNSDRCDNTSTHVWHTTSKFYKLCSNFKKILPTFLDIKQTLSANWRFRGWIPPVALGF
jgi:hypothetical protein